MASVSTSWSSVLAHFASLRLSLEDYRYVVSIEAFAFENLLRLRQK